MQNAFSDMRLYLVLVALMLGVAFGMLPKAQAESSRDSTRFHCWAEVDGFGFEDEGHIVSVRGKIHPNGVLHTPVFVDVDGDIVARYSGPSYSSGPGHIMIEGIKDLDGHLILRYLGEGQNSNYLFFSRDPQSRSPGDAFVDTKDVNCHFIPEW